MPVAGFESIFLVYHILILSTIFNKWLFHEIFSYLSRNFCLDVELQLNTQFIKDIEGNCFSFQGEMNSNNITNILDSLEIKLNIINLDAKTKKGVLRCC